MSKTIIEKRPNYYRNQLLLEDDFLAEQNYHVTARRRHNKELHGKLHGWGVVHGLDVLYASAHSITVKPGFAIDESGNEILLKESERVDVEGFQPHDLLKVSLTYEEESPGSEAGVGAPHNRRNCYAVVTLSKLSENTAGLTLATIKLDGERRVSEEGINYEHRHYIRIVTPGLITPTELHEELRKGWLRMPFRPEPMVEGPEEGIEEGLPAFRVGATEARSPHSTDVERDKGAAGTMAIPIPPSVKYVTRLRIAGMVNRGEITLRLLLGGWDREKSEYVREEILKETIPSQQPFFREYPIPITKTLLDPEYNTLSLWLRGTRATAVSLIAVEFGY
ncbi:MAG TPA: hypothetical protein VKK81_17940 [Candidatus Binatia bacterium]|nr:hypothetical protein [Candidatus Binatia bacterium]